MVAADIGLSLEQDLHETPCDPAPAPGRGELSGLSNGGEDELTMMLVETLIGSTTQTAFGACALDPP